MVRALFAALLAAALSVTADDPTPELDTITVVGNRLPRTQAESNRAVTIIDGAMGEISGNATIADLIEQAVGVDVRERGASGVQADLSIRGASFEQVLVLIDGVPMADPQTGHHQLDIPLTAADIERIEILSGQASRVYGPKAVAGVVNIVTREPHTSSFRLSADAGSFGQLGSTASASFNTGNLSHRISAQRRVTDGYRYNTDSDISAVTYRGAATFEHARFSATAGYVDKDFGADGFYNQARDQREQTKTVFASLGSQIMAGRLSLQPMASWRRHDDDFSIGVPRYYHNSTRTDVLSGALNGSFPWRLGRLAFGARGARESLSSDDLGEHARYSGGVFVEHPIEPGDRFSIVPGVSVYYVSALGWKVWPGLDVGFALTPQLRLFSNIDYAFREPTFTELYYNSPYNQGDPHLAYERSLSYEAGIRLNDERLRGTLSVYRREGRDVIDWVRAQGSRTWEAANVDAVDATGGEIQLSVQLDGPFARQPLRIEAGYAFVDMVRSATALRRDYLHDFLTDTSGVSLEYKYGSDYLRHAPMLTIDHSLLAALRFNWRVRYEFRNEAPRGHWLFDGRMYLELERFSLYAEATNLFDQQYTEAGSVPMPGRWLKGGMSVTLSRGTTK